MSEASRGKSDQGRSDWQRWCEAVWQLVGGVPSGRVLTYGQVAALTGKRRMARRVGQALKRAPDGLQLPWHRIVNAQGRISLPRGSAAAQQQRTLLEDEGVVFERGAIDLDRYGWRHALDQVLWGPGVGGEISEK